MIWSPGFMHMFELVTRPLKTYLDLIENSMSDARILDLLWFGVIPFVAFIVVIVVHEAGHGTMGLLSGLRLLGFRIGPILIEFPLRISLAKRIRGRADGATSLIPKTSKNLRVRSIFMVAGGPAANLVSAWLILAIKPAPSLFAGYFGFFSLIIGLGNLVPFRSAALTSDGMRIWTLLRHSAQGERWMAILRLVADLLAGVEPEHLPEGFIEKAVALRDNSGDTVVAHSLVYGARWFQHRDEDAAQCLETCLRYSNFASPPLQQALIGDAAVFQARRRKRVDLAEQWFDEIPEKALIPGLRLRAEAAILEARNDIAGALEKLDEFEKTLLNRKSPATEMSLRLLNRWRAELRQALGPPAHAGGASGQN